MTTGAQSSLALVTGAAHRLGAAIALALARRGYDIGLHYHRSQAQAEETATQIRALGQEALLLPADLTDPAQVRALFARLDQAGRPLGVLVNAAAIMPRGNLRDLAVESWDATLDLNLRAPFLCSQLAAARMPSGGLIVQIGDAGAHKLWTGYPAYAVSKVALEALTGLLAKTYAPGIRVNAVAPGLILRSLDVLEEQWAKLVQRVPLGRAGQAEQIVQTVEFLLDNAYITGQTLVVDGGFQIA